MKILKFNMKNYDPVGGMKYLAGVVVVLVLSTIFPGFPWFATFISGALAWLTTTVPGRRGDRLLGILAFLVFAAALIGMAHLLSGTHWPWFAALFFVAFFGTFAMIKGPRGFMTGWCLIIWFYVAPFLGASDAPVLLLTCHLLGSGTVLALIALPFLWEKKAAEAGEGSAQTGEVDPPPSLGFVLQHSTAVGLVMVLGLVLGFSWLKTDPTMIINASMMVMFPSRKQTVTMAVDRAIGGVLGVLLGFYLGVYVQSELLQPILWIIMSYGVVSLMNVNAAAPVFFFTTITAASWGLLDYDLGNTIANERIFAELVGVALAGIGITLRSVLGSDK